MSNPFIGDAHPLRGKPLSALETPIPVVDLGTIHSFLPLPLLLPNAIRVVAVKAQANSDKIQAIAASRGLKLRLHIKTHKIHAVRLGRFLRICLFDRARTICDLGRDSLRIDLCQEFMACLRYF